MKNNQVVLYIIVPCYNEEKVLPLSSGMFLDVLYEMINDRDVSDESRILFVDDGSKDNTWNIINELSDKDDHFIGIAQSRNRGHQNAVLAGLMESKDYCDITISIDCDGQDDINAMKEMVEAYKSGADVVYGVRKSRTTDTFFKRFTAQSFYHLLSWMGVEAIYNHADYRLLSSRVLEALSKFEEVNLFLRGMIPLVGFNSTCVYYDRNKRMAGETHYPFHKMMSLALDGITSLSIKPIRFITTMGFIVVLLSFVGIIWAIVGYFNHTTVQGWASTTCVMCFVAGIQLLSIGIIGEYIGKIYLEVKHRPRYIISDRVGIRDCKSLNDNK
ncbi:MAG: glycosyltransferase family 2 protein [Lachnospiraceae bacterium]|nr:glycosyltransferase family 2 protein [Lachnospiraceae bacterium]